MRTIELIFLCSCTFPLTLSSSSSTNSRIINGTKAKTGQFPWQVAIYGGGLINEFSCGGAIISEEWVLTAGHCVPGINTYKIVAGITNIDDQDHRVEMLSSEYYRPFEYQPFFYTYDIAVIKLPEPLEFSEFIQPLPLSDVDVLAGTNVTVSGWGFNDTDSEIIVPDLSYANLTVISEEECRNNYYNQTVYSDYFGFLCARSNGEEFQNPCNGDSGGALILEVSGKPLHVGLVSFGDNNGCETDFPVAFTKTNFFRDWIRNNTGL